jgi:hypothetical protein
MTSWAQFRANRRNALKSTGPRTEEGKDRSRINAVRHGLTAETVIGALEDAEDYKAFEAAVIADYCARTALERELVLRLASLLWRLRRSIAIETDLFQSQAEAIEEERGEFRPERAESAQIGAMKCCRLLGIGQVPAMCRSGLIVPQPTRVAAGRARTDTDSG